MVKPLICQLDNSLNPTLGIGIEVCRKKLVNTDPITSLFEHEGLVDSVILN